MVSVKYSVVIALPLEEVFAFAADFANDEQWSATVKLSRQVSPEPLGLGTLVQQITEFMGNRLDATGEVTEFEPLARACYRAASGPVPHQDRRLFESVEGGTRLTVVIEAELSGAYRFAEPIIRGAGQRQLEADLASLKRLLEARP